MRRRFILPWFVACLLVIMGVNLIPAGSAQTRKAGISHPGPWQHIYLEDRVRERYVPPPMEFLYGPEQVASANIAVNYIGGGWTIEAQNAFEYAVGIWESLITSSITIEVDATFSPLGENILGGAGPTVVVRDFPNAPEANTWYPVATANKLSGSDQDPGDADIQAQFSSNFTGWYFGSDDAPGDQISFASVVLHEIGHGLGFLGSMETGGECSGNPNWGCYGLGTGYPMIYDRFTENGGGTALLDYENYSTALGGQLTSNDLYFDSPGGNFANGGSRVPIYAPSTWSPGSSYSHLGESFNGTNHALMTYSIAYGETIHHPGAVTLCMFEEMGWTVSTTCSSGTDTPISGLSASNDGPTVFGTDTQLTANITSGSNVNYAWDFGDSTSGSGQSVGHQYTAPGTYTAEVTATNSINQEKATTTVQVQVAISGLAADSDSPTLLGTPTQMNAWVASGSGVSYSWDFGDASGGSGASPAHTYASAGVYIAEVTASNQVSQATATIPVQVQEGIAGLTAGNDGPTPLGTSTQLSASVTSGSNISYTWDFGDGTSGNGSSPAHTYTSTGIYGAEVTASNLVSQSTFTTQVLVEASITGLVAANDGPTLLGSLTQLTAIVSTGSNVTYGWDFGDGESGSGAAISHQYENPGTYIVELTANNAVSQEIASTTVYVVEQLQRLYLPLQVNQSWE